MPHPVTTARLDSEELLPCTPEEGGWIPVQGDADVRLATLCDSADVWSGVAQVQPSTFEYPAQHPGAIVLLEGSATVTVGDRSWQVGAGEVVYLTPGSTSTWVVHSPIREFFVAFTNEQPGG